MRFLYVVFILSTAALLLAAYAMARAVRRHGRGGRRSTLNLRDEPPGFDREADADGETAQDAGSESGSSKSGARPTPGSSKSGS